MDNLKYMPTFLRSALVNDPFSLGDLGPEDVLRIEAEFPELFKPTSHGDTSQRNVTTTPVSPPPSTWQDKAGVKSKTVSPETPTKTPKPVRQFLSPKSCTHQYDRPNVCSRGTRCASCDYDYSTKSPKIPVRRLNKFPLRKGPLPRNQNTATVILTNPSPGQTANNDTFKRNKPLKTVRSLRPPTIVPRFQAAQIHRNVQLQESQRKSDMEIPKENRDVDRPQPASVKNSIRKSPYRSKMPTAVLHTIEKQNRTPKTTSNPNRPRLHSFTNSPLHMLREMRSLDRIEEQRRLKSTQSELNTRTRTTKAKGMKPTTKAKGMKPKVTMSLVQTKQDTKLTRTKESGSDSDSNVTVSSSSSVCSCYELSDKASNNSHQLKKSSQQSESQTQQGITLALEPSPEISELQDPVSKLDQLVLARLLASKYEQEGRIRRRNEETKLRDQGENGFRPSAHSHPGMTLSDFHNDKLIEQVMQELIQAEILNHVRQEQQEKRRSVRTNSRIESELDSIQKKQLPNATSQSNGKLSRIDEESLVLVTPDLTPPETRYQQLSQAQAQVYKPVHDYEDDEDIVDLQTPELTPVSRNEKLMDRRSSLLGKPVNNINHPDAATDCSSFSDFIFSENEKLQQEQLQPAKQQTDAEIENISTPSKSTPVASKKIDESSIRDCESVSTPLRSGSNGHERFQYKDPPAGKPVQTSGAKRSKRGRSKSKASLSTVLSGLEISAKSTSKYLETTTDLLSEGELLLTPYKSNGEISFSSVTASLGLCETNEKVDGDSDDDVTDYEDLSSISEVGTPHEKDFFSDGEAPLSTTALLSKVDRLLNDLN